MIESKVSAALEFYSALKSIGIDDAHARSAAEKLDQALEGRLTHELSRMATREDLAKMETGIREDMARMEGRLIKWNVGTIMAVSGLTVALVKLVGA